MRDSDGKINGGEQGESGPDLIVGSGCETYDGGRKAVEREGNIAASVAVQAPCDPPKTGSEGERCEHKGQTQKQVDVVEFVAHLPGGGSRELAGVDALEGNWETGCTVGEDSIVDVAAGSEVAGKGRGGFPHFTATADERIVGVRESVVLNDPEALSEQDCKESCGNLLGLIETEFSQAVYGMGHRGWQRCGDSQSV